jgi:glycosyltransferase involved in cell wall biosynthesis
LGKKRYQVEQQIMANFFDFGIRTKTMSEFLQQFNPKARLHWHKYNIVVNKQEQRSQTYDIVFFARVSEGKGIEDLLKAVAINKNQSKEYTVQVIGAVSDDYLSYLKAMAEDLQIATQITWLGFLETQAEVHKKAMEAKICVLPTKNDIIPGTIVESMLLGIPVIAYAAGSIPELNDDGENVVLVEVNDIENLAYQIRRVLSDEELQKQLSVLGKTKVDQLIDNESVFPSLLKCYNDTIHYFESERENK